VSSWSIWLPAAELTNLLDEEALACEHLDLHVEGAGLVSCGRTAPTGTRRAGEIGRSGRELRGRSCSILE
jgi:hypothetical protein